MSQLLLGRAPLFDDQAHPAAYRLMTAGGAVDGLVESLMRLDVAAITRGLPMLVPVPTSELGTLLDSGHADALWVEPLEDRFDDEQLAAWRAAAGRLGGLVVRDFIDHPGHQALRDLATAGRVHAEQLTVDGVRDRRLRFGGLTTIATGVHTTELHRHCRSVGIDLVGGSYLDDVRIDASRTISGDRMTLLQLTSMLQSEDPSLQDVTALIERSPTLSYEVLRWINSAFIGLKHRVDDLRRAVGLLGPGRITQVVSLLLARDLTDRPDELFRVALVRARMCENLAVSLGEPRQPYYIAGLFSMLEALLEVSLETLVTQLPLTDEIVAALLHHDGRIGRVLQIAKLYQNASFDDPVVAAFDAGELSSAYLDALVFADEILSTAAVAAV